MEEQPRETRIVMSAIRRECALYYAKFNRREDYCCGGDPLTLVEFNPSNRCLILQSKRCPYFEEWIYPSIQDRLEDGAIIKRAYDTLRRSIPVEEPTIVEKPKCAECGKPRKPRHKYCDSCAKRKKRLSIRDRVNKLRKQLKNADM